MQSFPPTKVIRHKKENLKKCSLHGLESRGDFCFYRYPIEQTIDFSGGVLLSFDGPQLTEADNLFSLIVLDSTWRYAAVMARNIDPEEKLPRRSLPPRFLTAYPRRQNDCSEPGRGLASIEAIFVAYHLMGRKTEGLLDGYYWKDLFLSQNGFI